jgi:hypothetical protein
MKLSRESRGFLLRGVARHREEICDLRFVIGDLEQTAEEDPSSLRCTSLPLARDLAFGHRRTARADARSTVRLIRSLRSRSRVATPLGPGRRASNGWKSAAEKRRLRVAAAGDTDSRP